MDRPPIAGPGTETRVPFGWGWCGNCGYTGRVVGPNQRRCGRLDWHAWLKRWADHAMPERP